MFEFRRRRLLLLVCKITFLSLIPVALLLVHKASKHSKSNVLVKSNAVSDINVKKISNNVAKISLIDVEREMKKLNRKKVPADDPVLVRLIRDYFIVPPSELPYNLEDADKLDTSMGQAPFVDNRLRFKVVVVAIGDVWHRTYLGLPSAFLAAANGLDRDQDALPRGAPTIQLHLNAEGEFALVGRGRGIWGPFPSRLHRVALTGGEGGFFVESGAHDGEYLSNTLFLERTRHWTGILIEPLPEVFKQLQSKHRKAFTLNACLSLHPYPSMEYMSNIPVVGGILQTNDFRVGTVRVQCFPLYSVLLALNRTNVDFLSLDVEGVEHQVLETLPWNKVNITMLAVEYDKWIGGERALCKYMEPKGYACALNLWIWGAADTLFIKQK